MTIDKRTLARMRELCGELGPEDGLDHQTLRRRWAHSRQKRDSRKTRQLCGQVARVLGAALGCAGDPLLQELIITAVEPAPDAGRLRVWVYSTQPEAQAQQPIVMARLAASTGWLRNELGTSIHRKRVPMLIFAWKVWA